MAVSFDELIQRIDDSGLMAADDVRAFVDALPENEQAADAETLAKKLVADKKLTPFQAQQLWKGKGKSLVLGDYVINDKIGAGGMGMVFKAQHRLMKRVVAIKVLPPSVMKDESTVLRFMREVEAAAKLNHPNIITAFDTRQSNGITYLVMEYVDGRDLSAIVKKQGPTAVAQAVDFILQAARGLEFAHKNGVVHRDIKPANLLLDNEGTVKILDMGLARIEDDSVDAATQAGLTGTGTIMGTVDYMAPEQADDSKRAGPQADIYSLGATLHFLLTAQPMVEGDTLGKKLRVLLTGVGLPQSIKAVRPEVSAELDAIFQKMTAFTREDRYQAMTDVIADLETLQAGGTPGSISSSGIQPVSATRGEDSAMKSFLNQLEDGGIASSPTVAATQKTNVGAETMVSSVDQPTQLVDKKTASLTKVETQSKKLPLIAGGSLLACVIIGGVIWSFNGGETPQSTVEAPRETTNESLAKKMEPAATVEPDVADDNIKRPAKVTSPIAVLTSPDYEWSPPQKVAAGNIGPYNYSPWQSPDGLELWFTSNLGGNNGGDQIHVARRAKRDAEWDTGVPLDGPINTDGIEAEFSISADRQEMVFLRNWKLLHASRANVNDDWSEPVPVKTEIRAIRSPVLSADGLTLYLGLSTKGNSSRLEDPWDVYELTRTSRKAPWSRARKVEGELNSPEADMPSWVSADGCVMMFESNRPGGLGDFDFWLSTRPTPDAPWGKASNMGEPINSRSREVTGSISEDGRTMYFASNRPGKDDFVWVYVSHGVPKRDAVDGLSPRPAVAPFDAAVAKAHQEVWAKYLGEPVETTNSIGMMLALIPPGKFKMGSPASEPFHQPVEDQVDVTLTRPFRLGIHEVTQGQWKSVMGTEPWKGMGNVQERENVAAQYVSWTEATDFCRKLTDRERMAGTLPKGWEYRLPTEAEWEFACRAGTTTRYSFGDDQSKLREYAWFDGNAKDAGAAFAHAVGLKKPNSWGLYDIHGNVFEWCSDWGGDALPGGTDPTGSPEDSTRALRGGSWSNSAGICRSASRSKSASMYRDRSFNLGFRLALSPSGKVE